MVSKLERLRKLASRGLNQTDDSAMEIVAALPGLLEVCDAYIEAEAELSFLKESGDWEWHRERAREKLEEMLG